MDFEETWECTLPCVREWASLQRSNPLAASLLPFHWTQLESVDACTMTVQAIGSRWEFCKVLPSKNGFAWVKVKPE